MSCDDDSLHPKAAKTASSTHVPEVIAEESADANSVLNYLLYTASLPERAIRSGSSLLSGTLRESAALLVPQAFRSSKTYSVLVQQMLDFLAEDVGGVTRAESSTEVQKLENFVARKTVGNFVEMAGMATLHLSPLTLLAVVSDIAYGSQAYLKELGDELKKQGIIDEESTVHHAQDLLNAVARSSGVTASAFDTPPLSVEGLRKTIEETRLAVSAIDPITVIPQAELNRLWIDMHEMARREGVDVLSLSGAMTLYSLNRIAHVGKGALSSVSVAGRLFDRNVIDHYEMALDTIRKKGIYVTLSEVSGPYIEAVWRNFSAETSTLTEDLLTGKLIGNAWGALARWVGRGEPSKLPIEPAKGISSDGDVPP